MNLKFKALNFFSHDLCFNMRRISNSLSRISNRILKSKGAPLESTQYYLLIALYQSHPTGVSFTELSKMLLLDRTTVNRIIAPLVERGFATMAMKSTDKRVHHCGITESGRKAVEEALQVFDEVDDFVKLEIAHGADINHSHLKGNWMEELGKISKQVSKLNWEK